MEVDAGTKILDLKDSLLFGKDCITNRVNSVMTKDEPSLEPLITPVDDKEGFVVMVERVVMATIKEAVQDGVRTAVVPINGDGKVLVVLSLRLSIRLLGRTVRVSP